MKGKRRLLTDLVDTGYAFAEETPWSFDSCYGSSAAICPYQENNGINGNGASTALQ